MDFYSDLIIIIDFPNQEESLAILLPLHSPRMLENLGISKQAVRDYIYRHAYRVHNGQEIAQATQLN